jgi:hypothetical protein
MVGRARFLAKLGMTTGEGIAVLARRSAAEHARMGPAQAA